MKLLLKLVVLLCFFLGNCVSAEPFKVLVLPVDLFSVCDNYYCFPEVSDIFAEDIINNFNISGKILSNDLYSVRKKISEDVQLKSLVSKTLEKYKNNNFVDFESLKKISNSFNTNSVLLISSSIGKRNAWEVLEVSSAFDAVSQYDLKTNIVLTDNVNDIIMWSGRYTRTLGDNESSSAQANSEFEKIRFYSRDIISKNVSQNVILRFYPKILKSVKVKDAPKTNTSDFRPNPLGSIQSKSQEDDYGEIQSDTIYDF